ncbi:MAG: pyrimidine 5'-nucleotidase [Deltaproteobacteria bacterium]|nr:pyrimidine 5'-nucleotidase [Deltaproteobacteria bacterium]
MKKFLPPEFMLFDLDNTLYPRHCGLFDEVDARINRYLAEVVKIPPAEVDSRRRAYLAAHGTTLNGLIVHHDIDPEDYLDFVHDVPLAAYLKPNPRLKQLLSALPGRKYIFSNASRAHCRRVLACLELDEVFAEIFDLNYFKLRPKPEPAIYHELLNVIDGRPERGVMIDDLPVNLAPAAALGLLAVHYHPFPEPAPFPGPDILSIRSFEELAGLFETSF